MPPILVIPAQKSTGRSSVVRHSVARAMKDFPPRVTAYTPEADEAPDTRTPTRFLVWLLRQQAGSLVVASIFSTLWLLPQSAGPWLLGRAIDEGVIGGSTSALLTWAGLMLTLMAVGAVGGVLERTLVVRTWPPARYSASTRVTRTSAQPARVPPRRTRTGEGLGTSGSDADQFGRLCEVMSALFGAVVGFVVVTVLILSASPMLGLVVL